MTPAKIDLESQPMTWLERELGHAARGSSAHTEEKIARAIRRREIKDLAASNAAKIAAEEDTKARLQQRDDTYITNCTAAFERRGAIKNELMELKDLLQQVGERVKSIKTSAAEDVRLVEKALGETVRADTSFMVLDLVLQETLLFHGVKQRGISRQVGTPDVVAAFDTAMNNVFGQLRVQMRQRGVDLPTE